MNTELAERTVAVVNLNVVAAPKEEEAAVPIPPENLGDNNRASWNFSLHQLRANIAHCSAEGKEALVAAFLWCIDPQHPVHRRDFSKRVDYSENTIWKIFQGKYSAPDGTRMDVPKPLVVAIRSFLKLERERYEGGKTEFVKTPTSDRIFAACDNARESQTPAFMWGHSHCGKTWALKHYVSTNNHGRSVYCRVPAAEGLGGFMRALATSVGVSDNNNTTNLIRFVKKAISPDMLVVLDELHQLVYTYRKESFFASLEVLRDIYDATQCGMVLCGTKLMLDRIDGARHAELEQLYNRGTHRLNVMTAPTWADVKAIITHWKLDTALVREPVLVVPKGKKSAEVTDVPYDVLRQLSTTTRLKAITERLRYGRKLATKAEETFSWKHFLLAHHTVVRCAAEMGSDWA